MLIARQGLLVAVVAAAIHHPTEINPSSGSSSSSSSMLVAGDCLFLYSGTAPWTGELTKKEAKVNLIDGFADGLAAFP